MKIFAKCDGCPAMGELNNAKGRPDRWVAADIESPNGRVSLVLCQSCAAAKLGDLVPQAKEAPSVG